MEWCVLKNCGNSSGGGLPFAIEVFGKPGAGAQLTLKNTIIENAIGYGILSFGGRIDAENCLVHDCGAQALAILQGGIYHFTNCDFINYFPKKVAHADEPTVGVLNYFPVSNSEVIAGDLDASFTNCVIHGSLENELFCDKVDAVPYSASFINCLIKNAEEKIPSYVIRTNCIMNQDSLYENYAKWNFRPKQGSPLIDNGVNNSTIDLDNFSHAADGKTDIGSYEYH